MTLCGFEIAPGEKRQELFYPCKKTFGIDQRQQNDLSKKSGTVQRFH